MAEAKNEQEVITGLCSLTHHVANLRRDQMTEQKTTVSPIIIDTIIKHIRTKNQHSRNRRSTLDGAGARGHL